MTQLDPVTRPNARDGRPGRFEPDPLRIGKAFGALVATQYPRGMAAGTAQPEEKVTLASGRAGRIDLLLAVEDNGRPLLVVVEVKSTDWDARAPHRMLPNLARHARQVWRYLDALMPRVEAGELSGLQAALVYPHRPSQPGRAELVERVLERHGISVLFYDELEDPTNDQRNGLQAFNRPRIHETQDSRWRQADHVRAQDRITRVM